MLVSARSGAELSIDGAQAESVKKSVDTRKKVAARDGLTDRFEFEGKTTDTRRAYTFRTKSSIFRTKSSEFLRPIFVRIQQVKEDSVASIC